MSGNEPEAADVLTYDFDHLELELVDPDYIEGWGVWPGRISYSHTGYQSGATKSAIASGMKASEFRLMDQATAKVVAIETRPNRQNAPGRVSINGFFGGAPERFIFYPSRRYRQLAHFESTRNVWRQNDFQDD